MKKSIKGFILGVICTLLTINSSVYAISNDEVKLNEELNTENSNEEVVNQKLTNNEQVDIEKLKTSLDFISIDGMYEDPYMLSPQEAQVFIIAKTEEQYNAFKSLTELDKIKVLNDITQANYGNYLGINNVYVDFIYNGNSYAEMKVSYGVKAEDLKLTVKDKGEKRVVLKQIIDEQGLLTYDYYYEKEDKYPFSLTDEEIQEAIDEGKKGIKHVVNIERKQYTFKENSKFTDELIIATPYLNIMRCSAIARYKNKVLTFEEAKEIYNDFDIYNFVNFEFTLKSRSRTGHQDLAVYLEQEEVNIDSDSFYPIGLNLEGKYNSKISKYEASIILKYSNMLSNLDGLNTLDFNKNATFKIVSHGRESIYDIDFSSMK